MPTLRRTPIRLMPMVIGWWCVNGYHQVREVTTSSAAVEVKAPRVNDKR
jgi:hypothetical protein